MQTSDHIFSDKLTLNKFQIADQSIASLINKCTKETSFQVKKKIIRFLSDLLRARPGVCLETDRAREHHTQQVCHHQTPSSVPVTSDARLSTPISPVSPWQTRIRASLSHSLECVESRRESGS